MIGDDLAALEAVQFSSAMTAEDIWSPVEQHVEGLHAPAARALWAAVPKSAARRASPVGIVLQGERGVGKTHLLRWLRQRVQEIDGYFFLLRLMEGDDFWRNAVHGILDGFQAGSVDQLSPLLRRLATACGLPPVEVSRIAGTIPVARADLDSLLAGLRRLDAQVWNDCQDTLRALVLFRADRPEVHEVGNGYLSNDGDVEEAAREEWGFRPAPARSRKLVLRDLSRLLALTGPSVFAVDQIDPLISHSASTAFDDARAPQTTAAQTVGNVADGLMELRELTRCTLTVVACLPTSWTLLTAGAVESAKDRFRVLTLQGVMPDDEVARAIVAEHLGGLYAEAGHVPPYPTWPVRPEAFDGIGAYTPRRLLRTVEEHVRACLEAGRVSELSDLQDVSRTALPAVAADPERLNGLDAEFEKLRAAADVSAPFDPEQEDELMQRLLAAGLQAYIVEMGDGGNAFSVDTVRARRPPVHARLRHTLDDSTENEVHYTFRAIAHSNARAVQSRITAARTEAGVAGGAQRRALVLLRNRDWPRGRITAETVERLEAQGGVAVPLGEADIRTLTALEAMRRRAAPGWRDWLLTRRPAESVELFRRFLPGPGAPAVEPGGVHDASAGSEAVPAPHAQQPDADETDPRPRALIGTGADGLPVAIPVEALRKHTAVFAGSGSGKTVLLRRLVEECALQGVSSIVLDINNDLCRLGDPWPRPPVHWLPGDQERSETYLDGTEVVIWTPGRSRGRPLTLRPLPDFAAVSDDEDEFRMAVDSAVSSLEPHTGLSGRKLAQGKAVLREVLTYFVEQGGTSLGGLVELLAELPEDLTTLRTGVKLAEEMSEALRAARINDPLLRETGEPLDPGVLLTPPPGRRARISVISFVGLPVPEQRQAFVNQLQMALFSWIKANPAGERPLGGLLVMDEAQNYASSGAHTACTASTIALASQARKYGLGLIFATQAPKGLHNQVSGNAATQFYGFLNSAAQISAAKSLARDKGGTVNEISRLGTGQFYLATEGRPFDLMRSPQCLSHHPPSPPEEDEVVRRAAEGRTD
ncbi:hypothetical protein Ae717Ps2_0547 [Pseudonocardia sp. Ae717_Ps2]|uniref:helicase HerA domain-containing protein n=1 Tax=Pseudonocardia sp. Ae717_Ps2 TaxID=1885573 RepID=UPI00094AE284|nr:DUF87 domain-containing protein [Pseudonocardia sp. Ae717_Ps2]OLM29654.1 hypothetical protein Ae717Ps2_0547 [Pseudonocardia sp. Ae717_Ps2]